MGRIYAIRTRSEGAEGMLCELTAQELRDEIAKAGGPSGWPRYQRVNGSQAHKWVRNGGYHETGLYIADNGRIRYAQDGY